MQIIKDIYLLSGHSYGMHPNVYGVRLPDNSGLLLVDTGLEAADREVINQNLRDWSLHTLPITHVLISHAHFDHAGNAEYYQSHGAKLYAGQSEADGMMLGDARTIPYAYSMAFPKCRTDFIVQDGQQLCIGGLTVICRSVPGHTAGSMAYEMSLSGKRLLFTGDFLMASADCTEGVIGIAVGEDYSSADYLQSLRSLCAEPFDCILGGHGHPALRDGGKLIDSAYRRMLINRI